MNIFLTSYDQREAASHLDDLRLNKMILETAQLLSSAHRHLFGEHPLLYRDTHLNHPCAIWARRSAENFGWLVGYFDAVAEEKMYRDSVFRPRQEAWLHETQPPEVRPHKSWAQLAELFRAAQALQVARIISAPAAGCQPIFDFNCTDFKDERDVVVAYRKQLDKKWLADLNPPRWTGRERPEWCVS